MSTQSQVPVTSARVASPDMCRKQASSSMSSPS